MSDRGHSFLAEHSHTELRREPCIQVRARMNDTTRVMVVLSPVLWLVLSVVFHGYLASRDDEADAVVPAMSGAFLAVLGLWVAFLFFVNRQT